MGQKNTERGMGRDGEGSRERRGGGDREIFFFKANIICFSYILYKNNKNIFNDFYFFNILSKISLFAISKFFYFSFNRFKILHLNNLLFIY